ncbi:FKBP-type peptidyl-prolyl cis-trans isomerase [Agromyces neolithicus]
MNRALRRAAPIALASAAALLLAGCAGGTAPEASETPAAAECMDVASGSVSEGVTVEGEFPGSPTATFTTPLVTEKLERTVAIEGDGDVTEAGQKINAVVTLYSAASGDELLSQPAQITVGDETVFDAFRAGIDCVPLGSRTVTVAPAAALYDGQGNEQIGLPADEDVVIVIDVVEVQEPLKPAEWTENVPEVKFGAEGEAPTVTLPKVDAPTELQMKVLEEGDGDTVGEGDSVTVHYQGISWDTGEVFDQSYTRGEPSTFTTDGVIQGFGAALVGQKVGTKLIVVIPPEFAYGTDPAAHELGGQTLVFLVEIEGTEPPAGGTEPPSQ